MTTSPLPPDPYAALSVAKDASIDQIRSSYRKLVLRAHPDRFPQASPEEKQKKTDEFHKIQQAYELLSDDTRKQRYDDRVKLAELKAELLKEQNASRPRHGRSAPGSQDYSNTRSFTVPTFESRNDAFYEERVPKSTPKKPFPDEAAHARYDPAPQYDEYRSSPRTSKQDDSYRSSARRPTTKQYDEDMEAKIAAKEQQKQQKERERQVQADKQKARDKERKKATEAKQYYSSPRMEYVGSESSDDDFRRPAPSSRKRTEEPRRSHRDPRASRRSREINEEPSDEDDEQSHHEFVQRHTSRVQDAMEYIKLAKKAPNEVEERPRAPRTSSKKPAAPPPPPPPQPPMVQKEKTDSIKRSSASKKSTTRSSPPREVRSSRKEKLEILEPESKPSRRSTHDSSRARPGLKSAESAPPKIEPELRPPMKAATWQSQPRSAGDRERDRDRDRERDRDRDRERERERERDRDREMEQPRATMRRSQTTPLEGMLPGHGSQRASHGASKLRRTEAARDIDTESEPETPTTNGFAKENPMYTRYRYTTEPDDMDGQHKIVSIEPEPRRSSRRDPSPRVESSPRVRERAQSRDVSPSGPRRPGMPNRSSGSHRVPGIQRASTFAEPSSSPKQSPRQAAGFQRSASFKPEPFERGALFGEIVSDRPSPMRTGSSGSNGFFSPYNMNDVSFSKPIDKSNIQFSERRRSPGERERGGRGSDRERSRERSGRDSYPKDGFSGSRHGPSNLGRPAGKAY